MRTFAGNDWSEGIENVLQTIQREIRLLEKREERE